MDKTIGIVAFEIGVPQGFEKVRSAHIQLPAELTKRLTEDGMDVIFFTNKHSDGTSLPPELKGCQIIHLPDPRRRKNEPVMHAGPNKKPNLLAALRGILRLVTHCRGTRLPILHFFGGSGVGVCAGIVSLLTPDTRVVWTQNGHSIRIPAPVRWIMSKVDIITTSTLFQKNALEETGLNAVYIKHGVQRTLHLSSLPKKRVTYWRDPSIENGADLAFAAFERMAKRHPDLIFTFMLRPHFKEVEMWSFQDNVEIYRYPYPKGVSLEGILSETIVCYFPFRELSTNPQLCILESVTAGLPCVVSDIESVSEYILDSGLRVPVENIEKGIEVLEKVIADPKRFAPITPASAGFDWSRFLTQYKTAYGLEK